MYLKFTAIKLYNFAILIPQLIFMVTFATAAAVAVVLVLVAVVIVAAAAVILVVVVAVVVLIKSTQALMLTCNQDMRSSNYGHDTNLCDQFCMFFISPHR
jgi:hypothetical protein